MIKIAIIKEFQPDTNEIAAILSSIPAVEIVGVYELDSKAVNRILFDKPDIAMIYAAGYEAECLDIAAKLQKADMNIKLVIIFNDGQYALKAYEAGASAYILNPFTRDKLLKTIFKLKKH